MTFLLLLSAAATAPAPAPVLATVAAAPVLASLETPDLSAPPSPHAPMRLAPRLVPSQEEAMVAVRPVSRSARPRWKITD